MPLMTHQLCSHYKFEYIKTLKSQCYQVEAECKSKSSSHTYFENVALKKACSRSVSTGCGDIHICCFPVSKLILGTRSQNGITPGEGGAGWLENRPAGLLYCLNFLICTRVGNILFKNKSLSSTSDPPCVSFPRDVSYPYVCTWAQRQREGAPGSKVLGTTNMPTCGDLSTLYRPVLSV